MPVRFQTSSANGRGRISNISRLGLFVLADDLPQPREPIQVWLELAEDRCIEVSGSVRWTTDQLPPKQQTVRGFGVELVEPSPEFLAAFEELMLS